MGEGEGGGEKILPSLLVSSYYQGRGKLIQEMR